MTGWSNVPTREGYSILELTRFRGHLKMKDIHDAKDP
jgi:hypothetical protein